MMAKHSEVQPGFQQHGVVGKAGQGLFLLARHLFEFGTDDGLNAHGRLSRNSGPNLAVRALTFR